MRLSRAAEMMRGGSGAARVNATARLAGASPDKRARWRAHSRRGDEAARCHSTQRQRRTSPSSAAARCSGGCCPVPQRHSSQNSIVVRRVFTQTARGCGIGDYVYPRYDDTTAVRSHVVSPGMVTRINVFLSRLHARPLRVLVTLRPA
jgi:hypothetical protein